MALSKHAAFWSWTAMFSTPTAQAHKTDLLFTNAGILAGWLHDKIGTRALGLLGTTCGLIGLTVSAFSSSIYMVIIGYGCISGLNQFPVQKHFLWEVENMTWPKAPGHSMSRFSEGGVALMRSKCIAFKLEWSGSQLCEWGDARSLDQAQISFPFLKELWGLQRMNWACREKIVFVNAADASHQWTIAQNADPNLNDFTSRSLRNSCDYIAGVASAGVNVAAVTALGQYWDKRKTLANGQFKHAR